MNKELENIEGLEFINSEEKTHKKKETRWSVEISLLAMVIVAINVIGGFILSFIFECDRTLEDFSLVPIIVGIINGLIFYPLIMGFSTIVAAAEKKLKE